MKPSGNRAVSLKLLSSLGQALSASISNHSVETIKHVCVCTGCLSDAAFNQIPFQHDYAYI